MIILLLFLPLISSINGQYSPILTFEDYYQFGKNEYTDKNWPDCVAFMKRAVDDFKLYEDEMVDCRKKCDRIVKSAEKDGGDIATWHEMSETALCLIRCKRDRFEDSRPAVRKMTTYFDMMERKPYQYMHICYYRQGELGMAVQSAYTFYVSNPTDQDIIASLQFYMKQEGYSKEMLIDMERKDYEMKFISGIEAYDEQDWARCVHEFDSSFEKAMIQDEKCRYLCQDKIDWSIVDGNPDISVLFASIKSSVIRCEHNCLYKLGNINGHYVGNLIAAHFEYLHFCQYKMLRGSDAAQSIANYLLFDDSPLMRRNKYFYKKQYKSNELYTPSQQIIDIYKKRELEKRYLDFVERRFKLDGNELPSEQADDHKPLDTSIYIQDDFPYNEVTQLLKPNECKILRSALPTTQFSPFIDELTRRVKNIWKNAVFDEVDCGKEAKEAKCERAIVLSTESDDCGEWLGRWYTGCGIVFCDDNDNNKY